MPWIIAGGAILGGLISNRASAKQAALARDEAGRYSGTAHQREVADLRAAGLNPVLSGTGGAGASTPSGMVASQQADFSAVGSKFMEARRAKQEIKNMKEQQLTVASQGDMYEATKSNQSAQADVAGQKLIQELMTTKIMAEAQPGHMDAAKFWSSEPYGVKRRVDAAAETARILIPLTTPGHSAYGSRKRRR